MGCTRRRQIPASSTPRRSVISTVATRGSIEATGRAGSLGRVQAGAATPSTTRRTATTRTAPTAARARM